MRPSRAEEFLRKKVDTGIHMLQKGISIGQGAYQIGRAAYAAAPYVAAML